ncbi:hypothetical protein CTAYLR_008225 [Chrysophaeum taylorii]|uniref:Uncharacterized protein n=1 Tax=Chrysophaeum taylorii TaxID=2483200 RepID=A0AAD7UIB1_9STRA|nr:hypothetical protein CTAYLR_008225 [Chrysophaeum taylorii]
MRKFQPLVKVPTQAAGLKPAAPTPAAPTPAPPTPAAPTPTETWEALYAKKKGPKKRVMWHDGVLRRDGDRLVLIDDEGAVISRAFAAKTSSLAEDTEDDKLFAAYRVQVGSRCDKENAVPRKDGKLSAEGPALGRAAKRVLLPAAPKRPLLSAPATRVAKKRVVAQKKRLEPFAIWDSPRVELVGSLAAKLRPHQLEAVKFLYACLSGRNATRCNGGSGAILADEPGLGKTLTTLSLLRVVAKATVTVNRDDATPRVRKVAILCPATIVGQWVAENTRWFGRVSSNVAFVAALEDAAFDGRPETARAAISRWAAMDARSTTVVLVVSYETCLRHSQTILNHQHLDALVFDEGHRLKKAAGKLATAIRACRARKRLLITGTPAMNNLDEFWALADIVNPGVLGSLADFKRSTGKRIEVGARKGATRVDVDDAEAARDAVRHQASAWFLRRTQANVVRTSIPPKTEHVVCCRMTVSQKNAYRAACARAKAGETEPLAAVNELRTLSTRGPAGDASDHHHHPESGKLDLVLALVSAAIAEGDRLVLVSTSTKTLDVLAELCASREWRCARLDGSTPADQRTSLVRAFNSPSSREAVFLLSSRAGGCGLNLVGANRLVLVDADWNPATDEQAMARVWRDGQTKPVHIYRLLSAASIDEKILQRQLAKHDIADAVVDGADARASFDAEDLRAIFDYDPDLASSTFGALLADDDDDNNNWPPFKGARSIDADDVLRQAAIETQLVTYLRSARFHSDGKPPVVLGAKHPEATKRPRDDEATDDDDEASSEPHVAATTSQEEEEEEEEEAPTRRSRRRIIEEDEEEEDLFR